MEPRLRIVAWVIALITAAGAGYAVGLASDADGEGAQPPPAAPRSEHRPPVDQPPASTGAADEYEISARLPHR